MQRCKVRQSINNHAPAGGRARLHASKLAVTDRQVRSGLLRNERSEDRSGDLVFYLAVGLGLHLPAHAHIRTYIVVVRASLARSLRYIYTLVARARRRAPRQHSQAYACMRRACMRRVPLLCMRRSSARVIRRAARAARGDACVFGPQARMHRYVQAS